MKRTLAIALCLLFTLSASAQEAGTRLIDSLESVLHTQEGRDKVLTMIELTWEFYDVSYYDCLNWGERAIKEAQAIGAPDLEAKGNYVLGIQYAYHADMDLAKEYLQKSYNQYVALDDTKNAFEALWNIATYELSYGNIDTAYQVYEEALSLAEQMNDTLSCADVVANMALILFNKGELMTSNEYFVKAIRWYEAVGDELHVARMESNMAVIWLEQNKVTEAYHVYRRILPKFEAFGDNHYLLITYKNIGEIYAKAIINYDSAMYYFEKAIAVTSNPDLYRENAIFLNINKSGTLVEMGNVFVRQERFSDAVVKYEEALNLAEECGHLYGQMEACVCLGMVYSQTGQTQKSMQYFKRYFELENVSNNTKLRPMFRKALCMDYARLGMMHELETELSDFEEIFSSLELKNQDLSRQAQELQSSASELLLQRDSQSQQIEALTSQRNHYRLAFFGLLAIVISVVVCLVAYKIVRKKRPK